MQILLVLGLSFLMGLEREEHKLQPGTHVSAGVRTFPLIALLGYMLVVLSPDNIIPMAAGLVVVGLFLYASYQRKLAIGTRGFTSEMAALVAYVMGALIAHNEYWIAVAIAVADVFLLSAKASLTNLTQRLDEGELVTFVKFLLLCGVILPLLPDRSYSQFGINPFRTWLIVVAVSGISYGSYLLQRALKSEGSVLLSALLGGAYSSTLTTVTLAKQSRGRGQAGLYAGAVVLASAVMYLRVGVLIYIFNPALASQLVGVFTRLVAVTAVAGLVLMAARSRDDLAPTPGAAIKRNPLELTTAFVFAALFLVLTVATRLVSTYLGSAGVYTLAGLMGVTDIDPFIMGMAQTGGVTTPMATAAMAVVIASGGNNIIKGVYAVFLGGREVGTQVLLALTVVSILGLVWIL